jgi:WD40 repeat protein
MKSRALGTLAGGLVAMGVLTLALTACGGRPDVHQPTYTPRPPTLTPTAAPSAQPPFGTPTTPHLTVTPIAYPTLPITPGNAARVVQLGMLPPIQEGDLIGVSDFALLPVSTAKDAADKIFVAHGYHEPGMPYPSLIKGMPVWNIATGRLEQVFGAADTQPTYKLALSADGRRLITIGVIQYSISLWNVPTGQLLDQSVVRTGGPANNIAFSPDGQMIAEVDGPEGGIGVYSIHQKWPFLYRLPHDHVGSGYARDDTIEMVFSADGTRLASVGWFGKVYLWDMKTGKLIWKWQKNPARHGIFGLSLSLDGRLLAAAGSEAISLWDVQSGDLVRQIVSPENKWVSLAFSPDGQVLAAATRETVQLWEASTGQRVGLVSVGQEGGGITKAAFSHDGKLLIAGDTEGAIRLWGVP